MNRGCFRQCICKNCIKAESTGWRATFFYPGGGTYKGCWLKSQPHRYGIKTTKNNVVYDGQWQNGKRHGHGTMMQRFPDGSSERSYVGEWRNDMRCGEGKQFYDNGTYYGFWEENCKHGLGIYWYKDGSTYMGEWRGDYKHGLGVHFYVNGNRYEGHFARGMKNGEGNFYHMHTGQLQKGMWENDVCKTSMMIDEFRHQVETPTEYPIAKNTLAEPDSFIHYMFNKYIGNSQQPSKPFREKMLFNYLHKLRHFAKFEPKAISDSKIPFDDVSFPCVCKKNEKLIKLREL